MMPQSNPPAGAGPDKWERIRELNDEFRRTFVGGAVMITPGVQALLPDTRAELLQQIRQFENFETGGDPYGEHDFGAIELCGTRFFWKIDYYNKCLDAASDDPTDRAKTTRVLTVMLATEY